MKVFLNCRLSQGGFHQDPSPGSHQTSPQGPPSTPNNQLLFTNTNPLPPAGTPNGVATPRTPLFGHNGSTAGVFNPLTGQGVMTPGEQGHKIATNQGQQIAAGDMFPGTAAALAGNLQMQLGLLPFV